jgi:glycosyltransferase involved in cell wall biosynthesis
MDSLDLYRWLEVLPDAPVSCTHHSVESLLLLRRAEHVKSPVHRQYLSLQGRLVEKVEKEVCPRHAMNIVMSKIDADTLVSIAPGSRTLVVPNGVDTSFFSPRRSVEQVPGRVLFLGPLYMLPNHDAAEFFVSEVWPLVVRHEKNATFEILGKASGEQKRHYESVSGVSCTGYVDDIRDYLERALCFVVPLRIGGGTRLKILDAWSMGKAVVSTSIGCEGLDAVDGENILIRDDPEGFAEAVVELLRMEKLRRRLGKNARETACQRYSWELIGAKLREEYRQLLSGS